jgi:hypothetical protein
VKLGCRRELVHSLESFKKIIRDRHRCLPGKPQQWLQGLCA